MAKRLVRLFSYHKDDKNEVKEFQRRTWADVEFSHHPCVAPKEINSDGLYAVCQGSDTTLQGYISRVSEKHIKGFEKPLFIQMTYALRHIHEADKVVKEPLELKNFEFSADGKNVILAHFKHGDEELSCTKTTNLKQLGEVFYKLLSQEKSCPGNKINRDKLRLSKEPVIAVHLIDRMRTSSYDADAVLKHPYFWSAKKKIEFLCSVHDLYRSLAKKPDRSKLNELDFIKLSWRDQLEYVPYPSNAGSKDALEKLLEHFEEKYSYLRKPYDGSLPLDLLRFIRNLVAHFWHNDPKNPTESQIYCNARKVLQKSRYEGVWSFLNTKFPRFFVLMYAFAIQNDPTRKGLEDDFLKNPAACKDLVMIPKP